MEKKRTKIATATESRESDFPGFMALLRLVENECPLGFRAIGLAARFQCVRRQFDAASRVLSGCSRRPRRSLQAAARGQPLALWGGIIGDLASGCDRADLATPPERRAANERSLWWPPQRSHRSPPAARQANAAQRKIDWPPAPARASPSAAALAKLELCINSHNFQIINQSSTDHGRLFCLS